MTPTNNLTSQPASAGKPMLRGGAIALILILAFLFSAQEPKPEWPKLWVIKPLIIVPLAGAMGGLFYYSMNHLRDRGGRIRFLANLSGLIGYIVALWLGMVLGLNGTWWD